jgi:hypothetical protein
VRELRSMIISRRRLPALLPVVSHVKTNKNSLKYASKKTRKAL